MSDTKTLPSSETDNEHKESGEEIGFRIRARRLSLGLTLGDISAASGLSTGALSQIERGIVSPTVRTLYTIANVLALSPAQLIDPEGFASAVRTNPYVLRIACQASRGIFVVG